MSRNCCSSTNRRRESIPSRAVSSGICCSNFPATASRFSSPRTTWTKPSAAATSPTSITANSSPTVRRTRCANSPTCSRPAPCASRSPHPKSPGRWLAPVKSKASAVQPSSASPSTRLSTTTWIWTTSARSFPGRAPRSAKSARSLRASKTSSWSSPTRIRPTATIWRPPAKRRRPGMTDIFRGFGAVFYKEALHVRRDFGTLFFSLIIPLLQMLLLGYGIDTNIRQINTVVFNADGRRESRELLDRLKNSDTFHVVRYVNSDVEMNEMIIGGKARVGIKIPVDYSDKLLHQMSAQVLVLIDGSDSSVAGQAINVTTSIGLDESLRRALTNNASSAVDMRPKLLFNPDSRSPNFFLPGLTAILLLNVTTFLTAFSIVREKERGTLEQLFVTPVRPMGLLLGKLLPYLGIGFFELLLILTFMRFVFLVPIHGSVLLLGFLSLPYLFAALSLGILISSKANSQAEAMQLAFLPILPNVFFSGYIFPRETIPTIFKPLSYLIPASYFINITRGVILRGAGISHLWTDGLALCLIGTL